MALRDDLEASLRAHWDRGTLAVYADHLQGLGEVRGELIVLDLRIEEVGPLPELVARRKELLTAWLATQPPGKIQHGFVDVDASGADPVFQTLAAFENPAAPYIRTVLVAGTPAQILEALGIIGWAPRPGLVRLVLRQWNEGDLPSVREAPLRALVDATPHLDTLELEGHRVLGDVAHPTVRSLRVSGWNAFEALIGKGSPLPSLTELDFAYASQLGVHEGRASLPGLLHASRLPALRSLDLSRNEVGSKTDPNNLAADYDPFELVRMLTVSNQLVALRLPRLRSELQVDHLRTALARMRRLERLEIRASPAQLGRDLVHPRAAITFF
ncbi:MAG: hypothetical protein H0T89_01860 [Deltaproteobacteria bacterium]|nr:hypothetical protein [Deltaproteobacteria bacterium]MDQ3300602.1 hypothetical protein [Myxococcota bacterium]